MRVTIRLAPFGLGAAILLAVSGPAAALDILLSNDDGYDAPGIVALQTAFKARRPQGDPGRPQAATAAVPARRSPSFRSR